MKTYRESGGKTSRPCRFTPGERAPGIHWIEGWLSPRAGLDAVKRRSIYCRESNPGRPARSYTDRAFSAYVKNVLFMHTNKVKEGRRDEVSKLRGASVRKVCKPLPPADL
jgi:hypothetical protein